MACDTPEELAGPDVSGLAPRYRDWPWREPSRLVPFSVCSLTPAINEWRRGHVGGFFEVVALVGLALLATSLIAPGATHLTRSGIEISSWSGRRRLPWSEVVDVRIPDAWPVPFEGGPSGVVCRSGEVVGLPGVPRAARRRLAAALTARRTGSRPPA